MQANLKSFNLAVEFLLNFVPQFWHVFVCIDNYTLSIFCGKILAKITGDNERALPWLRFYESSDFCPGAFAGAEKRDEFGHKSLRLFGLFKYLQFFAYLHIPILHH